MRMVLALFLILSPAVAAARGGSIIAAGGQWAALDRGGRCDAQSRVVVNTGAGKASAIAGFTFAADRSAWGQFHARLSRVPRPGATVMASVGSRQFLLRSRGAWAWARSARQDAELMAAVRGGGQLRLSSRDRHGQRFSDRFALDFAPTAIDAAAARCSRPATGQNR